MGCARQLDGRVRAGDHAHVVPQQAGHARVREHHVVRSTILESDVFEKEWAIFLHSEILEAKIGMHF
jgi:hypothetical protein